MKHNIKKAFMVVAVLLSISIPSNALATPKAYTLELNDNATIVIKGVVGVTKNGFFWPYSYKDKKIINNIKINYKGHTKDTLVLKVNNEELFKTQVTNDLDSNEIKAFFNNGFVLDTLNNYTFRHGSQKWTLRFPKEKSSNAFPQKETEDSSWEIITYLIVAIIVILLVVAVFIIWLNNKRRERENEYKDISINGKTTHCENNKSNVLDHAEANSSDAETDNNNDRLNSITNGTDVTSTEADNIQNQDIIDAGTANNDDCITNEEANVLHLDENYESFDENAQLIKRIIEILHLGENQKDEIVNTINSLKQNKSDNSQKALIQEEFVQVLLTRIERKGKKLKDIVDKAKQEEGADSFCGILDRFVNILSSKIETSAPTFESMLNRPENRILITKWCIRQLSISGYRDFDKRISPKPDEIFPQIADILCQAEDYPKNHHDNQQLYNGILTEEQESALLDRIVVKINKLLPEKYNIKDVTTTDNLINKFSEVIKMSNITCATVKPVEVKNTDLDIINNTFDCDINEISKEKLLLVATNFLKKKIELTNNQDCEDIFKIIKKEIEDSHKLKDFLDKIGAKSVEDVEKVIREKEYYQMSKSIKNQLKELLPNEHIETLQQLINKLITIGILSKEKLELIVDNLDEKIALLDKNYTSGEQDALKLIDTYQKLIDDEKGKLKKEIEDINNKNDQLQEQVSQKDQNISTLKIEKENLSGSIVNTLHTLAEQVEDNIGKTLMLPCSNDYESMCVDIEKRLGDELFEIVKRLKDYKAQKGINLAEIKHNVQELLIKFLLDDYSPIDKVCRYYAYSQMAYMADTSREEGIRFNRRNIVDLYTSINNLYIYFGIRFDLPTLFVMSVDEGHFNDLTGQNVYGDLDNLLPNSRNRFDKIDSKNKPLKAIVDIVKVGYSLNGELKEKTSVLTF